MSSAWPEKRHVSDNKKPKRSSSLCVCGIYILVRVLRVCRTHMRLLYPTSRTAVTECVHQMYNNNDSNNKRRGGSRGRRLDVGSNDI